MALPSVLFSPYKVVKGNAVKFRELYCRPQRQLALAALVPLVNRKLHIEVSRYLLLRFVVIFTQIADAHEVQSHHLGSNIPFGADFLIIHNHYTRKRGFNLNPNVL